MRYRSAFFLPLALLALCFFTAAVFADEKQEYYTLQAASFSHEDAAVQKFEKLQKALKTEQLDYLRVEKVQDYYTVRLGRFLTRGEAESLLLEIADSIAGAVILQAYVKEERISKLVTVSAEPTPAASTSAAPSMDQSGPHALESAVEQEFYTLQAVSYRFESAAARKYQDLLNVLQPEQRDHLRVEKVQGYYTVRLGKFASWDEAEALLRAAGGSLAGASILQAYIKDERITKLYLAPSQPEPDTEAPKLSPAEQMEQLEAALKLEAETLAVPGAEKAEPVQKETAIAGQTDEEPSAALQFSAGAEDMTEAELEKTFQIVEEDTEAQVESAGQIDSDNLPPDGPIAEPPAIKTAGAEGEETAKLSEDILAQGEKFTVRGQPTGFEPAMVVKIFNIDLYGKKMSYPSEIHYDRTLDEIYVMSAGNTVSTRITVYGPDYFPVAALGEGRGIINSRGLTVDAEGNIYVAMGESTNEAGVREKPMIRVLNAAFFQKKDIYFADIPEVPSGFVPEHLALGFDNDTMYVTGRAAVKGVLVLDMQGNFKHWLVPIKSSEGEEVVTDPAHPKALAVEDVVVDSRGRVYLLCALAGRILVLDQDENFLFAFGELGGSTGKLSNPRSVAVDASRQAIYVVDYMRHAVNVYNYKDGKYLFEFGGQGVSPGWFQFPVHVETDRRGNVIVADMFNHRVQIFDVP